MGQPLFDLPLASRQCGGRWGSGFGGGWGAGGDAEGFDGDVLVEDVEDGEGFCAAGGVEGDGVSGGGLHECSAEG